MDDILTLLTKMSAQLETISAQLGVIQSTIDVLPGNITKIIEPRINEYTAHFSEQINNKFNELPEEIKKNFLPEIYKKIDELINGVNLASKQIETPLRTSGEIQIATLMCVILLNIILIALISSIINSMRKDRLEQKKINSELINKINETLPSFRLHQKSTNEFQTVVIDDQDNKSQQDSDSNDAAKQKVRLI